MLQIEEYQKRLEKLGNNEKFWESVAEELEWSKKWTQVLEWKYPFASLFKDAQTNIVTNAIDRHVKTQPDKTALIWVSEDLEEKKFSFAEIDQQVSKLANGLLSLGIKKGDRVVLYLPRIPELVFSMLACAKIGAVHSVVYSGFSSDALKTRINDAEAKLVITADGYNYKGKLIECKKTVDDATAGTTTKKVVVKRLGNQVDWKAEDL
jgi:acetyl-CoA synthetase